MNTQLLFSTQSTKFPEIHSNLNGMVREVLRLMHQDKKGNYWFGTNGDENIPYDWQILQKIEIHGVRPNMRVMEIVEEVIGNVGFNTWQGIYIFHGE